ncbi:oxidoreductase [Parapedobacter koreensis]|uniref:NAD(P)-dependent dehydrogenase, short-chain alcohol dehydrogenase family n=1 Tax=Parapedobacter koreensis TaxID=332977 RepID=A0A1H7LTC3_9SPHI|nr:oxidoreductase [Parapedobacter koreensis]SEL02172.1 NAD(P)-dependent dehydrogenase, short-chain alcohol dehydrogenase family [Parapedobacter koreensis]
MGQDNYQGALQRPIGSGFNAESTTGDVIKGIDLTGKTAIVTGANTGIGYETALALYEAGANVVVACRDEGKAKQAIEKMQLSEGKGSLEIGILNLANLEAIRTFAADFKNNHQRLDLLINNAGVMMPPASKTDDGFELQFGVNFIGHFALTGHLYPLLKERKNGRVVTVSSGASTFAKEVDFDNLKLEKPYDANREYAVSKLAGLQFAFELDRRLKAIGSSLLSTASHPGVVYTDLQRHIPEDELKAAWKNFSTVSDPWQGALPSLFAATSEAVTGGDYYGPDGEREQSGYPAPSQLLTGAERDEEQARKLWHYAQEKTGVIFPS